VFPSYAALAAKYAVVMRAKAGIQYAALSQCEHNRLGVLDRPVKPGDDSSV